MDELHAITTKIIGKRKTLPTKVDPLPTHKITKSKEKDELFIKNVSPKAERI